jgi:tetratricopeptide (TPR) repeat protein
MIVRRNVLRASKAMQERVMRTANIQILWEHQTKEILGDENGVTGVRLVHSSGEMKDIPIHGFFLAIGHHPNSEPFRPWIEVNAEGYILTKGKTSHTNVGGVLLPETCRTPDTGRQLLRQQADVWRQSMPNVTCPNSFNILAYILLKCRIFAKSLYFMKYSISYIRNPRCIGILILCQSIRSFVPRTDHDLKYRKAIEYYEAGKYTKAQQLFDQIQMIYRGTAKDDTLQYYLALSNYHLNDYVLAEDNFNQFAQMFPRSPFTKTARFLRLDCLYESTYRYELDQNPSQKAIAAIEEFLYDFPGMNTPRCAAICWKTYITVWTGKALSLQRSIM